MTAPANLFVAGFIGSPAMNFLTSIIVESLGSEKYIHFTTDSGGARAAQLAELAADSGASENEFVARVSAESRVTAGQQVELAFDTSKLVIFDADSGLNLTRAPEPEPEQEPEPVAEAETAEAETPEAEPDADKSAESADDAEENPAAASEPKAE
jgi:multiple sugar transport system ATP-binding protein